MPDAIRLISKTQGKICKPLPKREIAGLKINIFSLLTGWNSGSFMIALKGSGRVLIKINSSHNATS
jgi:hypothetical protein